MRATKICDQILPPIASNWLDRFGDDADRAKAETAEARHETKLAKHDARAARRRVRLATRSLKLAAPGIVLSSLGFTFAFGADGNGRVALMALLLFVAGTAAYVWSISLASGRLKPDSGPGTRGRSTRTEQGRVTNWRARRDSNPRPIA